VTKEEVGKGGGEERESGQVRHEGAGSRGRERIRRNEGKRFQKKMYGKSYPPPRRTIEGERKSIARNERTKVLRTLSKSRRERRD